MNLDPSLMKGLAQEIAPGQEPRLEAFSGAVAVQRGTVTAVSSVATGAVEQGTVTVDLRGTAVPGVPFYRGVNPRVGDVVDVLLLGPNPRIIGVVGPPTGLLAWAEASDATGGASSGRYGGGYGAGSTVVTVGTTQTALALGCAGIPVTPGHLLRIWFKFAAMGPPDLSNEWYFLLSVSGNGQAWTVASEVRQAPSGANAPSPQGSVLYQVPTGITSLSCGIDAHVFKNTGNLFRYGVGNPRFKSQFSVESLGPAL